MLAAGVDAPLADLFARRVSDLIDRALQPELNSLFSVPRWR